LLIFPFGLDYCLKKGTFVSPVYLLWGYIIIPQVVELNIYIIIYKRQLAAKSSLHYAVVKKQQKNRLLLNFSSRPIAEIENEEPTLIVFINVGSSKTGVILNT